MLKKHLFRGFVVALWLTSLVVAGQTSDHGWRIYQEAYDLMSNRQGPSALNRAMEKYKQAKEIFKGLDDPKSMLYCDHSIGNVYRFMGNNVKAIEIFNETLSKLREMNDQRGVGYVLGDLGHVLWTMGKKDQAVKALVESLRICQELGENQAAVNAMTNLGSIYNTEGNRSKALHYYEMALKVSKGLDNPFGRARILAFMGEICRETGNNSKAREYLTESIEISREIGNRPLEIFALGGLGGLFESEGHYNNAGSTLEKALKLSRKIGDTPSLLNCLTNLSRLYRRTYKYEEALDLALEAVKNSKGAQYIRERGIALLELGNIYSDLGMLKKALPYFQRTIKLAQNTAYKSLEASAIQNMAAIQLAQYRYSEGIENYETAISSFKSLNNKSNLADSYFNLSIGAYLALGYERKALEYAKKSLKISKELKDPRLMGRTHILMGEIYDQLNNTDESYRSYQEALKVFTGTPYKFQIGVAKNRITRLLIEQGRIKEAEAFIQNKDLMAMAKLYTATGEHEKAIAVYQQVLSIKHLMEDDDLYFGANTGLGLAYECSRDYSNAVKHLQMAVDRAERSRTDLPPEKRGRFFKVKVLGFKRSSAYEGLARCLYMLKKPEEAFKASEFTKARVFSESMARDVSGRGFGPPKEITDEDQALLDRMSAIKNSIQALDVSEKPEGFVRLNERLGKLEEQHDNYVDKLRQLYPLYAATRYPQPMGLAQTALKDDEWLVSYDVTDSGVLIYLTKGRVLKEAVFKPITREKLQKLIDDFRRPLTEAAKSDDPYKTASEFDLKKAKEICDLLISDVLDFIDDGAPIKISPDDCLGVLPFEALVLNEDGEVKEDKTVPYVVGAEFLGDRHFISYCQSAYALTLSRKFKNSESPKNSLLVVADPVFGPKDPRAISTNEKTGKFAQQDNGNSDNPSAAMSQDIFSGFNLFRLSLTGDLAKNLSSMYRPECSSYTGLEASKDNIFELGGSLTDYGKLVFATHGYLAEDLPGIREPFLLLTRYPPGTDGILRMSEVMSLKLAADLVALTACSSGIGERVSGEGPMSMGRAFQYAGAKSVLMSLWPVEQRSAVSLTTYLFENLKKGETKRDSLKLARQEIRTEGYDHPLFWAAFIMVGDGE